MSTPRLVAIVPTEDVLQTLVNGDGRYTLHRVLYDLYSVSFPSRLGPLTVNVVFCGGAGTYAARLRMISPQGHVASETTFKFEARTYHLHGVTLSGTPVEAPGDYLLQVELEGQIVGTAPLKIVPLGQSAQTGGAGR